MNIMKKIYALLLSIALVLVLSAPSCTGGGSGTTSSSFSVKVVEGAATSTGVIIGAGMGGIFVNAQWQSDLFGSATGGSVISFTGFTSSSGFVFFNNARLPARWFISVSDPICIGHSEQIVDVSNGDTVGVVCIITVIQGFSISPNPVNAQQLSPITMGGQGFDTTYGMPIVEFHDVAGNYLSQSTAFWVSGDGTQLQTSASPLAGLYTGSYSAIVKKRMSDGSLAIIGASRFDIIGNDPPPPPPPPPPRCTTRICPIQE